MVSGTRMLWRVLNVAFKPGSGKVACGECWACVGMGCCDVLSW